MGFEKEEYIAIYYNYSHYDHLKPLLLEIKLYPNSETPIGLKVKWIEKLEDFIYVDTSGWYVQRNKDLKYPTFESLAMKMSNEFNQRWGAALFKKLQDLEHEL